MVSASRDRGHRGVSSELEVRVLPVVLTVLDEAIEERVALAHRFPGDEHLAEARVERQHDEHRFPARVFEEHGAPPTLPRILRLAHAVRGGAVPTAGDALQHVSNVDHEPVPRNANAGPRSVELPELQGLVELLAIHQAGRERGDEVDVRVLPAPDRTFRRIRLEGKIVQIAHEVVATRGEVRQEARRQTERLGEELEGEIQLRIERGVERVHGIVEPGDFRNADVVAAVQIHGVVGLQNTAVMPVLLVVRYRRARGSFAVRQVEAALPAGFTANERLLLVRRKREHGVAAVLGMSEQLRGEDCSPVNPTNPGPGVMSRERMSATTFARLRPPLSASR